MSGDSRLEEQPLIFYSNEWTSSNKNLFDVVEIQGVRFQHRWRKGSAMEE